MATQTEVINISKIKPLFNLSFKNLFIYNSLFYKECVSTVRSYLKLVYNKIVFSFYFKLVYTTCFTEPINLVKH